MRFLVLALVCSLVAAVPVFAQAVGVPGSQFSFDQAGPSLANVNTFTATLEMDGTVSPTTQPIVCTGAASPFQCTTAIPAVTPGNHSVRIRVNETVNDTVLSSAFSTAFAFTMRAVPAAPTNIGIQ